MLHRTVTAFLPGCCGGAQADALAGRTSGARMNTQECKPRHNYRYVCAESMRLDYRGYACAL